MGGWIMLELQGRLLIYVPHAVPGVGIGLALRNGAYFKTRREQPEASSKETGWCNGSKRKRRKLWDFIETILKDLGLYLKSYDSYIKLNVGATSHRR